MVNVELKRGSTEMLILALLENRRRHGYEIGKQIETMSGGRLVFRISSLYPTLARLEKRGLVRGRWVERPGERRKRYYELTTEGRAHLVDQKQEFSSFVEAVATILRKADV